MSKLFTGLLQKKKTYYIGHLTGLILFSMLPVFFSIISVLFSPSMRFNKIELGLGSRVATLWERVAYSANHMFSLFILCLFEILFPSRKQVRVTKTPLHPTFI